MEPIDIARTICTKHGFSSDCMRTNEDSKLVFTSGNTRIVKLFSPQEADFFENEKVFLENLYQQLPIHTPRLEASGYFEEYPYIIMEKLEGIDLETVWYTLNSDDQRHMLTALGHTIRALHSIPKARFTIAPFHWDDFIENQKQHLVEHHLGYGLEKNWLDQLEPFVASFDFDVHKPSGLAPLHTELMLEHIFVRKEHERWVLAGLIDFEPSMVGHFEYEFCAVGLFLAQGNRELLRAFLTSYGYQKTDLTDELSRRIMIFLLLHRYSNLNWFRTFIPEHQKLKTLEGLETYWYGL